MKPTLLIALALLVTSGDAAASFRLIARARGPAVSDANLNAAYIDRRGATRVIDAGGRLVRTLPTPRPGPTYFVSVRAIGSGHVLWDAYHRVPPFTAITEVARIWIGSLATGAVEELDNRPWRSRYDDAFPRAIGAQWIEADTNGRLLDGRGAHLTFLNWHTGAVATDTRDQPGNVATVTPDLDLPELWRPLCPPLRRPPDNSAENEGYQPFLRYQYAPPFALPERQSIFRLQLHRCGQSKARNLSRCRSNCSSPRLGPNAVVWVEGRYVRVHRPARRCTGRIRLPSPRHLDLTDVVHTRSRVFVSQRLVRPRGWRIHAAPLPACAR